VSSKWTCPCNIPWLQCEIHRRVGFACGAACAKGNQFAPRSRAAALHSGYISSRHAAKLGVLGEGDNDKGHNIRDAHHKSCSPKRFLKFHHLPNSALREIKKQKDGMGATPPTSGNAQAGSLKRKVASTLSHCETCSLKADDLAGLKWAKPQAVMTGNVDPSIFLAQRPDSPKKARTFEPFCSSSQPCKGLCPKTGWTIDEFCSFCYG